MLESLGILESNAGSLKLAEALIEAVGYRCAGLTDTSTVAQFMTLSACTSTLAEKLEEKGLS